MLDADPRRVKRVKIYRAQGSPPAAARECRRPSEPARVTPIAADRDEAGRDEPNLVAPPP